MGINVENGFTPTIQLEFYKDTIRHNLKNPTYFVEGILNFSKRKGKIPADLYEPQEEVCKWSSYMQKYLEKGLNKKTNYQTIAKHIIDEVERANPSLLELYYSETLFAEQPEKKQQFKNGIEEILNFIGNLMMLVEHPNDLKKYIKYGVKTSGTYNYHTTRKEHQINMRVPNTEFERLIAKLDYETQQPTKTSQSIH